MEVKYEPAGPVVQKLYRRVTKKKKTETVLKKEDDKEPKKPTRGSTTVIRVAEGKIYAVVLNKLQREVNPDVRHTRMVGPRPTKKRDLIKIEDNFNNDAFTAEVTEAAWVRYSRWIKNLFLDCPVQEPRVQQALREIPGKHIQKQFC